jgi:peptidoglycan/LPS O-acetylase OafA/YrhL
LLAYCVYWLWVLVIILPFCFLFFLWVEKPGIKFGERFKRQKANAVTPAAEPSASVSEMPASENKKVTETDVPREEAVRV